MAYWTSRPVREKALIGVAILLAGLTLLQFAFVRPLMAARANASLALETASRQLDVVTAELMAGPHVSAGTGLAQAGSGNLRSDLLQLANGRGLAVSRLQAAEDGRLILQFEQTVPTLVYTWLADAEKRFGVTPERVSMFAEADGTVRASFEFSGSGS